MRPPLSPAREAAELGRAGVVTFGGQVGIVAALGVAAAVGLGDLMARRRARRSTTALLIGAVLYVTEAEPWMRRWGSTAAERQADLPGDDLVPDPGLVMDHAVTIKAAPDPEWQHREVGEEVMLHPLAPGMPVTIFDPPHALGLAGWGVFTLRPAGPAQTRLLVRGRIRRGAPTMTYRPTLAIPHFVMERRMLLGIKARAEIAD